MPGNHSIVFFVGTRSPGPGHPLRAGTILPGGVSDRLRPPFLGFGRSEHRSLQQFILKYSQARYQAVNVSEQVRVPQLLPLTIGQLAQRRRKSDWLGISASSTSTGMTVISGRQRKPASISIAT